MNILLSGSRHFLALDLTRNFGKNGHAVYTADSLKHTMAGASRYCKKAFFMPSVRFEEKAYIDKLCKIINEYNIDIVFPIMEDIFYIAKNQDYICTQCPNVQLFMDDFDKLIALHDKYSFYKIASELDIPTPQTYLISSIEDLKNALKASDESKFVLKPVYSLFGTEVIVIDKTTNIDEIDLAHKEWLLQEFIEGPLVCVYSFAKNGKVKYHVTYDNGDFKSKTGIGMVTFYTPVENDSQIVEYIQRIAQKMNFTGNLSFDFIKQGDTYYILECNPRITGGFCMLRNNDFSELLFDGEETKNPSIDKGQTLVLNLMHVEDWNLPYFKKLFSYPDLFVDKKDMRPFLESVPQLLEIRNQGKKYGATFFQSFYLDLLYEPKDD